jgi:hypothetical protein
VRDYRSAEAAPTLMVPSSMALAPPVWGSSLGGSEVVSTALFPAVEESGPEAGLARVACPKSPRSC